MRRNDSGATAIEYAILAGLIGLGIVGSLVTTRGSLSSTYGTASTQMSSATPAPAAGGSGSGYVPPAILPNFAPKTMVNQRSFDGCNLGMCGARDTYQNYYSDGSYTSSRSASPYYGAEYASYDAASGLSFYATDTGTGRPGEKLTINYGPYSDTMTFNADGSVSGTRVLRDNQGSGPMPASVASDYQWVYDTVAYIKAYSPS